MARATFEDRRRRYQTMAANSAAKQKPVTQPKEVQPVAKPAGPLGFREIVSPLYGSIRIDLDELPRRGLSRLRLLEAHGVLSREDAERFAVLFQ